MIIPYLGWNFTATFEGRHQGCYVLRDPIKHVEFKGGM
jgi:hypothetical protein